MSPFPAVGQIGSVNQVVRRAGRFADIRVVSCSIHLDSLREAPHTDAYKNNVRKSGTQAGYILGVSGDALARGQAALRSPLACRFKRVVKSTLSGGQALIDALGHLEWILCHSAEAVDPLLELKNALPLY